MAESTKVANDFAFKDNEDALAKVKASGKTEVYTPTPAERMALKKALVPVHKQMESRIGAEIIQDIYKATGFVADKL
jgi:C4-dicarboxylate-binding protein DctP